MNMLFCEETMCFSFSGCCFVTFFTRKAALKAQDALHNIKTLAGVSSFYLYCYLLDYSADLILNS